MEGTYRSKAFYIPLPNVNGGSNSKGDNPDRILHLIYYRMRRKLICREDKIYKPIYTAGEQIRATPMVNIRNLLANK